VLGVTAADLLCARSLSAHAAQEAQQQRRTARSYEGRSGFRRPAAAMRGAARDFVVPPDMRTPEALRPYPV